MGHEVSPPGSGKKAPALQPVFVKVNANGRVAQHCPPPLCYSHRQVGSDGESRWSRCLPGQRSYAGWRPSCCSSSLRCTADFSWVNSGARWLSCSTITLRLVSSKSLNGGMPAHLDRTRRRSAPMKSSATSLPKVAARSRAVVTSSRWQTGIGHVSISTAGASKNVCPLFLFLQCSKPNC